MTESITPGTGTTQENPTPAPLTLLQKCKNALGVTDSEYDDELTDLIAAAKADLGIAGVLQTTVEDDPLIRRAILAYVSMIWNVAAPEYGALAAIYETNKKQLMSATGYTDWLDGSNDGDDPEPETDPEEDGDG